MSEYRLDCIGEVCPVPLIKAEQEMKDLKKDDVLIVETDHNNATSTIPHWARKQGYEVEVEEVYVGEWQIRITKR